jgi:hypothetical protein
MGDDLTNRGVRDRSRINLSEDYERRYWENTLGISEHELRNAVNAVGDSADQVKEYLKRHAQRKGPHRAGYLRKRRP